MVGGKFELCDGCKSDSSLFMSFEDAKEKYKLKRTLVWEAADDNMVHRFKLDGSKTMFLEKEINEFANHLISIGRSKPGMRKAYANQNEIYQQKKKVLDKRNYVRNMIENDVFESLNKDQIVITDEKKIYILDVIRQLNDLSETTDINSSVVLILNNFMTHDFTVKK